MVWSRSETHCSMALVERRSKVSCLLTKGKELVATVVEGGAGGDLLALPVTCTFIFTIITILCNILNKIFKGINVLKG